MQRGESICRHSRQFEFDKSSGYRTPTAGRGPPPWPAPHLGRRAREATRCSAPTGVHRPRRGRTRPFRRSGRAHRRWMPPPCGRGLHRSSRAWCGKRDSGSATSHAFSACSTWRSARSVIAPVAQPSRHGCGRQRRSRCVGCARGPAPGAPTTPCAGPLARP